MVFRYKERLETKYIKPRKLRGNSETLVGSAWTFLEKGGDDFRDGLPPEANYNYVKKVRSAFVGNLSLHGLGEMRKQGSELKNKNYLSLGHSRKYPYRTTDLGILRARRVL